MYDVKVNDTNMNLTKGAINGLEKFLSELFSRRPELLEKLVTETKERKLA